MIMGFVTLYLLFRKVKKLIWPKWKTIEYKLFTLFVFFTCNTLIYGQAFQVSGNVMTGTTPVSYASITFIDQNNTTKKYSTITNSLGNYYLDIITSVRSEKNLPTNFELAQNYPNPFSSETQIPYKLNAQTEAQVTIYDILGREVRKFTMGVQSAGVHRIMWDGRNNFGEKVATGIYFYQLEIENETLIKKMVLLRDPALIGIQNSVGRSSGINIAKQFTKKLFLAAGNYTVEITNSDSTEPRIIRKEINDIIVQSDTILDFTVEQDIVEKYLLYITTESNGIHVYDTELHTFVDSISGFPPGYDSIFVYPPALVGAALTNSAKKMYVSTKRKNFNSDTTYSGKVYLVDLQTKERKTILSIGNRAEVYISPKGTPFIVAWEFHDTLGQVGIIDTVSDVVEWIDTLDILSSSSGGSFAGRYQNLVFDPWDEIFYSLTNQRRLFKYNYQTKEVLYIYNSFSLRNHVGHMVISSNGKYIYFANAWAVDLEKDSVVGYFGWTNLDGSVALSADDKFLCTTDPVYHQLEPLPSGKVAVFHTLPQGFWGEDVSYIDVENIRPGIGEGTDFIVMSGDGRKAYVSNWGDLIFVLDLEREIVSDFIELKSNSYSPRKLILRAK